MSKWIYTNEDGERLVVDLTDEEAAELMAAQEDDDDEDDEDHEDDEEDDGDDDDPDPPAAPARVPDTPEEFERVEAVFRKERAVIRASSDATDLRLRRQAMERVLRDGRQSQIAHTRARDLLAEIEQRELRILAERSGKRGR